MLKAKVLSPSVTRAPMVPAVTFPWPVLTPMGTGRGKLRVGSASSASAASTVVSMGSARNSPVTSWTTRTVPPSTGTNVGKRAMPGRVR
ncbi:MAG: hypothetical protein R3253_05590 [Longimicrobiales bacterium]|nr:hypothetical protein [Longimicrobiales bacterium]